MFQVYFFQARFLLWLQPQLSLQIHRFYDICEDIPVPVCLVIYQASMIKPKKPQGFR